MAWPSKTKRRARKKKRALIKQHIKVKQWHLASRDIDDVERAQIEMEIVALQARLEESYEMVETSTGHAPPPY